MRLVFSLLIVTVAAATGPARSQDTGGVRGTVFDILNNQVVAGAEVQLFSPATMQVTTTDRSGHFAFWSVPPGPVRVLATGQGLHAGWFMACVHADMFEVFRINVMRGGSPSNAAMGWAINRDQDFRQRRPDPSVAADLYSLGSC